MRKCRFFADGNTKKQNIKKFLKGESEGETISKMFPSHGCGDMAGSQTALAECRRAWDCLLLEFFTTEYIEKLQDHTDFKHKKHEKIRDPQNGNLKIF